MPGSTAHHEGDSAYLLARAAKILTRLGCPAETFEVVILPEPAAGSRGRPGEFHFSRLFGEELVGLPGEGPAEAPALPKFGDLPPGARPCSPVELEILAALADGQWHVTATLAERLGREPTTEFRCLVRNLADAGVIETCQRRGLRLVSG